MIFGDEPPYSSGTWGGQHERRLNEFPTSAEQTKNSGILPTPRGCPVTAAPVKVGIVGLGRWAKVLTRASLKSPALEIVAGYSRSEGKRAGFAREFGIAVVPDLAAMLTDAAIEGVILTVPNEQHLPLARQVAQRVLQLHQLNE